MIVNIAWRNVWRNKVRSFVVITAIALGLWGGIFSYAFMQGMEDQQVHSSIHTETGHIQINQPRFLLNYDIQSNMANSSQLEKAILNIPDVKAVTSRIQLTAMVSTAYSSAGIMVNGIDPASFQQVSELKDYLTKGSFFEEKMHNPILIGAPLAKKLHVGLHSRIVLTLQSYDGEITYYAFKVAGIFKLHDSEFNEQMAFVRKQDLQKATGFPRDHASTINILLNTNDETDPVENTLKREFPGLEVQSWIELSPMLKMMSGTVNQMSIIFVFIILLALAFGIINTMLMAVMDRTREIGMLLCIGMNQKKVFIMIVLETLFLSLTGALAGLLVSILSIYYFGTKGVDLSVISEGFNAWGYSSHVYPVIDTGFYPKFALMVIGIALFSSFFPARRAIRLKPAQAVRGE